MARPVKQRHVDALPEFNQFGPRNTECSKAACICMTIDEYESIRLIDFEGLTQAECAVRMNIARSTVQSIYAEARHKMACALINGNELLIKGGDIRFGRLKED